MSERFAGRRDRLREILKHDGVQALLVTSATNVRYLTGFTGDDSALLVAAERELVVSDGRYTTQLQRECPDVELHIRPVGQTMMPGLAEMIAQLGITRLAFEASAITVADFEELKTAVAAIEFNPVQGRVESLRVIKDDAEIEAIRAAVGVAESAFELFRGRLAPDVTEKELTDHLETDMRRCGAEGSSFAPIVAVGPNAALPHYRGTAATRIGEADFVLVDWGAQVRLYKSDLTRVVVTGKVTTEFAQIYQTVLAAQERAIAAIRPGVLVRDVDGLARSVIEQAGFGGLFTHGLGHGLGLDIHESPRLRRSSDETLEPGMVVTVEPGIYRPLWGGVRIEDDVLVTPEGASVLSRVPKTLDSLLS
jgi:Xaa-Pro aminopeptidase